MRPGPIGPGQRDPGLLSLVDQDKKQRSNNLVGTDTTQPDALSDLIASLSGGSDKSDSSDTNTSSAWNAQVTLLTLFAILIHTQIKHSC